MAETKTEIIPVEIAKEKPQSIAVIQDQSEKVSKLEKDLLSVQGLAAKHQKDAEDTKIRETDLLTQLNSLKNIPSKRNGFKTLFEEIESFIFPK